MPRFPSTMLSLLTLAALLPAAALTQPLSSYYTEPGTYGTQRESEPPRYVRNLGAEGGPAWLDFGLDLRLRHEYRDDDIRRPETSGLDQPLLVRTRAYAGLRTALDPLRLVVEFEDARSSNSRFAASNRDVNEAELIQGLAELYYPDLLGTDPRGNSRPLSIRAGRMAFELLDRRLLARNEWRNTTNNFDGLRISLGQQVNDWQLELLRLKPVVRLLTAVDKPDQDQTFTVVTGHWRKLAPALTLEPHYMVLRQHAAPANANRARDIRAGGLRLYGQALAGALNFDASAMHQGGTDGGLSHRARSFTFETGYSWLGHPWRPRVSAFYGYASGDRNPADSENNRFDRFFGFARPWSANDYITFDNIKAPKLRLELQPLPMLRMDLGYSRYTLTSCTDRYGNLLDGSTFNRDPSGNSGDHIGDELDLRVRMELGAQVDVNIGYAHFRSGEFVSARQRAFSGKTSADSDFFYAELTLSLF